jgi:hypothetical protein
LFHYVINASEPDENLLEAKAGLFAVFQVNSTELLLNASTPQEDLQKLVCNFDLKEWRWFPFIIIMLLL